MKKHAVLLLAMFMVGLGNLFAQDIHFESTRCIAAEIHEARLNANPDLPTQIEFENWLAPLVSVYEAQQSGNKINAVSTIPVVFHVIHNGQSIGSGANLSTSKINAQLSQLNSDFRNGSGVDTEIEFCMAAFDPDGNAMSENGINRIDRNVVGWSAPPYGRCSGPGGFSERYIERTIKPQSSWNPERYLNIWVMEINCGILGYAQFPNSSGLSGLGSSNGDAVTDGVVVHSGTVGSGNNPGTLAPYNEGRTLTHELGHFFGLRHIWGDGGCSVDDYCGDTPTSDGPNFGCPSGTVSCGSIDQIENFMDYTDDNCMSLYTADQKARMQTVLSNSPRRVNLTTSTACTASDGGSGGGGGGGGGNGNGNGNGNGKPKRVGQTDLLGSLEVFPIPAHDLVNVQFESEIAGFGNIAIVDLLGRTLTEQTVGIERGGNVTRLQLEAVPAGTYLLRVNMGDVQLIRRIAIAN